jgi:hypothetical protein
MASYFSYAQTVPLETQVISNPFFRIETEHPTNSNSGKSQTVCLRLAPAFYCITTSGPSTMILRSHRQTMSFKVIFLLVVSLFLTVAQSLALLYPKAGTCEPIMIVSSSSSSDQCSCIVGRLGQVSLLCIRVSHHCDA